MDNTKQKNQSIENKSLYPDGIDWTDVDMVEQFYQIPDEEKANMIKQDETTEDQKTEADTSMQETAKNSDQITADVNEVCGSNNTIAEQKTEMELKKPAEQEKAQNRKEKITGLTSVQVEERVREGKVNTNASPATRSCFQIVLKNIFTFFNFINAALFAVVILVGSYKNSMFMGVMIVNTVIGIVQEIRAKKTIDELAIMTVSKIGVIRNGSETNISVETLVQDDIIRLKTGDQIPADAVVVEGSLEVNESLLTGESDNLDKQEGMELYSGSFVTSGTALAKVTRVGNESYASKITSEAKKLKKHNSELRNSLNTILKIISIIILPLGAALFYKQYLIDQTDLQSAVVHTVSAIVGMIPEGLVLLTSMALTIGALTLARRKTLVQELYCIETLARVDTICLDKTGTITEGTMKVEKAEPLGELTEKELKQVIGNILYYSDNHNPTEEAMRAKFPSVKTMKEGFKIPFSSDRKYSGISFIGKGSYYMGAAQFLFPFEDEELAEKIEPYRQDGFRVLVLAHSEQEASDYTLPDDLIPMALIVISDVIRAEAPDTLAYFDSQGVNCKIISGDDAVTVAQIAKRAGLSGSEMYVDATTLRSQEELEKAVEQYNVFGRVTPQQKKEMVLALKKQGHTVAMTGDGVNDVLALKEADCSIAMASGSEAAKNIANIVLLTSDFGAMPHIVNQGRKVINNIRTAASMFLIKTFFSVFLTLITLVIANSSYPFEPLQMSLISIYAVGVPTFILAQEPNYSKIQTSFLRHVMRNALPAAITITGCVFTLMMISTKVYHSTEMLGTACVLVTGWNYMATLKTVYNPLNLFRKIVINGMQILFFLTAIIFQKLLVLGSLEFGMLILVFMLMTFAPLVIDGINIAFNKTYTFFVEKGKATFLE